MPDNENGQIPVEETTTPMPSDTKPENEDSLPEGTSDRTREQFEKLKETNRELAQKLEAFEKMQPQEPKLSALERLRPTSVTPPSQVPTEEPDETIEIDENGYIDEARLKKEFEISRKKAKDAEERAKKAEQMATDAARRVEEYEISSEKKRVHSDFPEIDPYSDKFDSKLYDQVSKDMLWNLVNVGRENFYETAMKVVGEHRNNLAKHDQENQVKTEAIQQAKSEAQDPSRSGSIPTSRKEELMRAIQQPKAAGLNALTELMRDY